VLANPLGEVSGRVRKQSPAIWEAYFFKGELGSHAIETTFGKIGVGICFDNQTADVAAILSRQSVDLVLMPHSYPAQKIAHPVKVSGFLMQTKVYFLWHHITPEPSIHHSLKRASLLSKIKIRLLQVIKPKRISKAQTLKANPFHD